MKNEIIKYMQDEKIDLTRYWRAIKKGWIWYAISAVLLFGIAISYCVVRMPQFESFSRMLIENNSDNSASKMGGMASLMRTFSIGGFGSSSVDNEILIIDSHSLKKQTSSRLGLNRTYVERNGLKKTMLYKNSPVIVEAPSQLFDTLQTSFKVRIKLKKDGLVDIKATRGLLGKVIGERTNATLPCSLETPYGMFQVLKTANYSDGSERTIDVLVQGDALVVGGFKKVLDVGYASKKSDGIDLTIVDASKERGCDILNTMMALYNERRIDRKSECALADIAFLEQRIANVSAQLMQTEVELQDYKTKSMLVSAELEVPVLLQQDIAVSEELIKLQVEEMTLKSIFNHLQDEEKKYALIPMSESLGDDNAASVIRTYNELILKRNSMLKSAKEGNIVLQQLTDQIDAMRINAIDNVKRLQDQWRIKYNKLSKESNKFKNRMSSLPKFEREYINLARDREMQNALYVFLVEKRESAMLKQNNNQELGFVYEPAYSAIKPLPTKSLIALGVAFVLTIVIGTIVSIVVYKEK